MTLQGKIIDYLENDKFICAFVIDNSGNRLKLLNQNGRDVNLSLTRIVHQSQKSLPLESTREELLKELQRISEKRQSLMNSIDPAEVWTLISEEADNIFETQFLAEICFGKDAGDDHIAAFLRSVFRDRIYFKYKEGNIVAHSPEVVGRLLLQQEKEQAKEQFLTGCADNLIQLWQGNPPEQWPDRDICLRLVHDYYLFGNEAPQSDVTRELMKRARLTGPQDGFHLLVRAGIWHKNENIPLLRNNIHVEFSDAALAQADTLIDSDPETLLADGRKDFRKLPLITIDGVNTRDFDDALHLEQCGDNFRVGVHVTDVAHYIKPGDPLFQEAMTRGTSIYFPEGPVPMLPKTISEGLCSLVAGKARPAMSFMVLLSAQGNVLDYQLTASVVEVRRQLSYSEANRLIGKDEELTILSRLSCKLRDRRLSCGALLLPFPDVNIFIGDDGPSKITLVDTETPSRILISEFMILANTLAAQFMTDREITGLFRSQPPPRQRLMEGYDKDLFINIRQRKNLSPMTLSTRPNPHSGLGVPQYTTVTSPIRRLLDLIMQHQLLHHLKNRGLLFTKKELKRFAETIGNLLAHANSAKRLRHRYWILKYLEPKVGEQLHGLVIDKGPRLIHLVLIDFMLDTDLPTSKAIAAEPGQLISVKLVKADALNSIIKVEW